MSNAVEAVRLVGAVRSARATLADGLVDVLYENGIDTYDVLSLDARAGYMAVYADQRSRSPMSFLADHQSEPREP